MAGVAALLLGFATQSVHATAPRPGFSSNAFVYKAVNVPLVDLLRDFAGAQRLPLVIADGVNGVVNADFKLTPEAFLDTLSKAFGLIWYFDGVALYVYPSSLIQTRLILTKELDLDLVAARLAALGLGDRRYPLRYQKGAGLVLVFGPPRHLELVEAVIGALLELGEDAQPASVRAFALTYASAVDRVVRGVKLPGLASTLTEIYKSDKGGAGSALGGPASALINTAQELDHIEGTPEDMTKRNEAVRGVARSLSSSGGGNKPAEGISPSSARLLSAPARSRDKDPVAFSADEATNSVIVRAAMGKMKEIEALIAKLDAPSEMVEIEATIIDIASEEVQGLGFDWRYTSNSRDVQISPALATPSAGGTVSARGSFNITTLFRGDALDFLARIRALEARGSARVVSQPRVLGAANRTASLSDKRTASVRVAGNQDARLFSVEAGTLLQMTPRLILAPDKTRIGMELLIEDGGFGAESVDQVPVVQRTTIRTDVMVNEGQSVLIGGIAVQSSRSSRSGVPWLSKLPLVGAAFSMDDSTASKRQRMFMLTPKRVVLSAEAPAAGPGTPEPLRLPDPAADSPAAPQPASPESWPAAAGESN